MNSSCVRSEMGRGGGRGARLVVPLLPVHLLQRRREVGAGNLLLVLELEELVAAVAGEVDEHVAPGVAEQPLAARNPGVVPPCAAGSAADTRGRSEARR